MERIHKQRGMSGLGLVVVLAVIGYAVFIALQYIPQAIETGSVDTILGSLEDMHDEKSFRNTTEIRNAVNRQLDVNDLNDLRDAFSISDDGEVFLVNVSYENKLNMLYGTKVTDVDKTISLRK